MSLRRYVLRRALLTIPILFGVSVLTFGLVKLLPGTPVDYVLQFQESTPELRTSLRAQYHLDEPLPTQYALWLWDVLHLDFGQRVVSDRSVTAAVAARLPATLLLGGAALLVALLVGVPAGVLAAVDRGGLLDESSRIVALAGIATPNFWLGLLLILLFGVHLNLVPVIPPVAPLLSAESLAFLTLPAITLGTASAALFTRLTRLAVSEELRRDYVRTARAKGLAERTVIVKHVLRNSLVSVVTVAAVQVAVLLDGAVVIERVFSWPGLGRLLVRAILQRDFPVVQAVVLLVAVAVVVANLLADVLYGWLDPRIRY
ncbi:ABC transporter permease [Haloplanus litoreus]|uniref:ABC transporter permease n=1 Tax=Haloplanus litoreus TaxID=767515 RepID=A0ABD5ZTJ5_9EURY